MKKVITFFITILLLFSLTACENEKSLVSEQHLQYGERAIEIADLFLDYEITAPEAREQLEKLMERESELPDYTTDDPNRANNSSVETYTFLIASNISLAENNATTEKYNNILEYRDTLAKVIGIKQRKEK